MMRRLAPAGSFALAPQQQRAGRYASADVRSRVRAVQAQERAITRRAKPPLADEGVAVLERARAAMWGRR